MGQVSLYLVILGNFLVWNFLDFGCLVFCLRFLSDRLGCWFSILGLVFSSLLCLILLRFICSGDFVGVLCLRVGLLIVLVN